LDQLHTIGTSGYSAFFQEQLFYQLFTRRFGGKVRSKARISTGHRHEQRTDIVILSSCIAVLFGPSFTCIFFATILMQSGDFSLKNWLQKIRADLPGAWLAGIGYWPIVDLLSYSVVPVKWIPLFVNGASFIWTIYLSLVANKKSNPSAA